MKEKITHQTGGIDSWG